MNRDIYKRMLTRVPIPVLALFMTVASASADRYEISAIHTSSQYASVNNAWTYNTPCVEVALRVMEEIGTTAPSIKAYFFNKDREMVFECARPSQVSFGDGQSVSVPATFKPGRKSTIYFAVHPNVQRGKNKWKYCVVVFGDKETVAAMVYPKEDIQQFTFQEKSLVGKKPASK